MRGVAKTALVVLALTAFFVVDDILFLLLAGEVAGWPGPAWLAFLIGFFVLAANFLGAIWVFRFLRKKPVTGKEGMIGVRGVALDSIEPNGEGQIRVRGEIWRAVSDEPIGAGQKVIVKAINGLTLLVAPVEEGRSEAPRPS